MVCSSDVHTYYIGIVNEGHSFVSFLIIIHPHYALRTPIDLIKEDGLTLKKSKKQTGS